MARKISEFAAELVDREAIRDCIARLARVLDRMDEDGWRELFWPEATDDHAGAFNGCISDLINHAIPLLGGLRTATHMLGNTVIEICGDQAHTETYLLANHVLENIEKPVNAMVWARYVDTFEKRDGEWRLLTRRLLNDWFLNIPASGEWSQAYFEQILNGERKPADTSYQVLGQAVAG